jgi:hypothetical protein
MFCPECGAADQRSDTYCRKCGRWLPDIKSIGSHKTRTPDHIMRDMMVFSAVNALLALTSAIVLYATYLGSREAKWSVYVAAAFSLVISIHQMVSFSFNLQLRRRFARERQGFGEAIGPKEQQVLMSGATTGQLVNQPSVTEKTTELLEAAPLAKEMESRGKTIVG